MTISVRQLSAVFENINSGKFEHVKQIAPFMWECNGLFIEKSDLYGINEYSVFFCGDDVLFLTFGDAVEFCMNAT